MMDLAQIIGFVAGFGTTFAASLLESWIVARQETPAGHPGHAPGSRLEIPIR
jgi:hypothetical protein